MPAFTRLSRKVVRAKAPNPSGAGSAIIRVCADANSRALATYPAVGSFRSARNSVSRVRIGADSWTGTVMSEGSFDGHGSPDRCQDGARLCCRDFRPGSDGARMGHFDGFSPAGQRKALIPVIARPTMRDWMESVPS